MILTRTYLNFRRQGARKFIESPQKMHAAVLSGFPPQHDPGRTLWRLDFADPLRPALFVLSRTRPDFTHIEEQAGWPSQPTTQSTSYEPFLDRLECGQSWGFRVKVNPTRRVKHAERSKIMAHATAAHQMQWLLDRATAIGVALENEDGPLFELVDRDVIKFRRNGSTVTLGVAVFQGVLTVLDPERLRTSLTSGIGRAKAYGCGLMTLAKA